MANFAEIDENNIVIRVLVTDNNDENGDEGLQMLNQVFGGTWVKASYNTVAGVHKRGGIPFRKNFPGAGYIYDEDRNAFYTPKPFESWVLNEDTCVWNAPVEYPIDGQKYFWNEDTLSWELNNE
jgi:hypothetical protein